jgi:hypothetical protein
MNRSPLDYFLATKRAAGLAIGYQGICQGYGGGNWQGKILALLALLLT